MNQNIFRKYDIRGIYGLDLTDEIIEKIGYAIGSLIVENNSDKSNQIVVIARDVRISSPIISEIFIKSICKTGVCIHDLGIQATPVFYHYVKTNNILNGIVITGSHNSKDYNGFKLIINGKSFCLDNIKDIYNSVGKKNIKLQSNQCNIKKIETANQKYCDDLLQRFTYKKNNFKNYKIVIDSGNSVASLTAPKVFKDLGCDVIELHSEIDGNFPNHNPDPSDLNNLQDLQKAVINNNADLGFAYDGDADRLGVVTSDGNIIFADILLMIFAKELLQKIKKAKILYDVKCTDNLEKVIRQYGGEPIMCPTGHSIIKNKMRETHALLAGEMSGHFFFSHNWYGFDDAIYASVKLLDILANNSEYENLTLKEVVNKFYNKKISTPEISIYYPDSNKNILIENIIKNSKFENAQIITIDGLRVEYEDCWGVIRASNTTPNITLRFEGDNEQSLNKIKMLFQTEISKTWPEINLL